MQARSSGYDPMQVYYAEPLLRQSLDAIANGAFSPDDPSRFRPVVDSLLYGGDTYMLLADFLELRPLPAERGGRLPRPAPAGRGASILNVANMGHFSSDRTILGYARDVWGVYVPPQTPQGRARFDSAEPLIAPPSALIARGLAAPA